MDKLKMETKDLIQENIEKLAEIFPGVVTEARNEKGNLIRTVDFELLKQELAERVVEGDGERYQLTWPGKKEAMLLANLFTNKTLRPVKEGSVDWENTGNLYIEGDNLEALKILQESYLNKIKCIYIDPPYNTGKDFIYKDNFKQGREEYLAASGQVDENGNRLFQNTESNGRFHSDWLSMMYPRLKLARNLLREDGVIFISVDDNEVHNLRKICDEVFGERNFGSTIIVQTNKGGQDYLQLAKTHEYLLCYFKGDETELNLLPKNDVSSFKYEDLKGKYELRELRNRNPKFNRFNRPNLYYPIYVNPNIKDEYGCCPISLEKNNEHSVIVYPLNSEGKDSCWRWGFGLVSKNTIKNSPNNSNIVAKQKKDGGWNIYEKNRKTLTKAKTIWDEKEVRTERGTIIFRELFRESYFDHTKPVELVDKVLRLGMDTEDIILDFFAGSCTTAHAVMQLNAEDGGNRKYIMVQLPEPCPEDSEAYKAGFKNISEIGKERIRRAGEKIVDSLQLSDDSKEVMKQYGCIKLSRSDCLAKSDGPDGSDLFSDQEIAKRGSLRSVRSDETSCGVNSLEHSGGTRKKHEQGIHSVSGNSTGIESGIGDSIVDLRQGGIPCRFGYFGSDRINTGNRQNAECPYYKTENCPLKTVHCQLDTGFRVFKVDSSNIKDVYYRPDELSQQVLLGMVSNIKEDRTAEDLLIQVMLEWGLELSLPIEKRDILGKEVHFVAGNSLAACFEEGVSEGLVREIAREKPLRVVFRDSSFADDATRINAEELFKMLSPTTEIRVI
ncbi:MAG: hypothetical protein STSR0004_11330 [Peptococcaceae bacterium]